jgi:hypothetical protein
LIILVPYVILAISLAVLWAVVGKSPPRLTLASLARLLPANTSMIAIIGTSVVGRCSPSGSEARSSRSLCATRP